MNPETLTLAVILTTYEKALRALWVAMNVDNKTAEECTKLARLVHFSRTAVEMKAVKIMGDTDENAADVKFKVSDLTECWEAMMSGRCGEAEYISQRDHFVNTITGAI